MAAYMMGAMGVAAIANSIIEVTVDYPKTCDEIGKNMDILNDVQEWSTKVLKEMGGEELEIEESIKQLGDVCEKTRKMIDKHRKEQAKLSDRQQIMSLFICFIISMLMMLKLMNHYNLI